MPNDWAGLFLFEVLVLRPVYKVFWWGNGQKELILAIFTVKRFVCRVVVADPNQAQNKVLGNTVYTKMYLSESAA